MATLFPRPQEKFLYVNRERLTGAICPRCGRAEIYRYPVLTVAGWRLVERCQGCLYDLKAEPTPYPWGLSYQPLSTLLPGGDPGKPK